MCNTQHLSLGVTTRFLQKGVSNYIWIITYHYYFRDDKSHSGKYEYLFLFFFSFKLTRTIPFQHI
jgi:hypothetical protein